MGNTVETDITKENNTEAGEEPEIPKINDEAESDKTADGEEEAAAETSGNTDEEASEGEETTEDEAAPDGEKTETVETDIPEDGDDFAPIDGGDGEETKKTLSVSKKTALKISGIVLGSLAVIYLAGVLFYNYHFFFKTNLGNFDCSNLTPAKAAERIKTDISDYSFTLIEHGDAMESVSGNDISLAYQSMDNLVNLKKQQNPFLWFIDYDCRNLPVNIEVTFDNDALYQKITELKCVADSNASMVGATGQVYYDDANIKYTVNDSGADNIVSVNRIFDKAKAGITELYKNMYLESEGCYVGMAEEDKMKRALDDLNRRVGAKVTYTRGEESSYLDGGSIHEWLTLNDDYTVTLDEGAVESWVEDLAALYNTIGTARSFTTSNGSAVTVYGGDYGWHVNTGAEAEALVGIINNGEETTREPIYSQTAGSHGPNNDLPNTYVEISIGDQHVWFFKDGSLIVSTDCVTGDPTKGNSTDTGIYYVKYKERNATLKGEGYETPVSFWMPFNGGQGLHDLTSRGAFGGSIYRGNGSHGCVNLPYGAANSIYDNIERGVAVVVY